MRVRRVRPSAFATCWLGKLVWIRKGNESVFSLEPMAESRHVAGSGALFALMLAMCAEEGGG